ncbi:hypothetical protein [[Scytonema hofmanni] UTEX B 1581]|nr:hypothetical protein [[Scytonema hofmanni] UTEX B 1581]
MAPSPQAVSPLGGVGFRPVEVANPEGEGWGGVLHQLWGLPGHDITSN